MATQFDFFEDLAPSHLEPDMRTMMIADWSAKQAVRGFADEVAALLAEMLAGMRAAGTLDDASTKAILDRWEKAFATWRTGNGKPAKDVTMQQPLRDELAWCLPGLAPETGSRTPRHGLRRAPSVRRAAAMRPAPAGRPRTR